MKLRAFNGNFIKCEIKTMISTQQDYRNARAVADPGFPRWSAPT